MEIKIPSHRLLAMNQNKLPAANQAANQAASSPIKSLTLTSWNSWCSQTNSHSEKKNRAVMQTVPLQLYTYEHPDVHLGSAMYVRS